MRPLLVLLPVLLAAVPPAHAEPATADAPPAFGAAPQGGDNGGASAGPAAGTRAPASLPRKRIAVLKFDPGPAATQGADLGAGLAAQLSTALLDTGQFIVVERAELASVLREQELGAQKLAGGEAAAQVGKLLGAQLLVRASVTEFEQRAGGGGLRIGIGLPLGNAALGGATNTGVVGIDLRLVDTTTGQVVQSYHAESKIEDRGVSADVGVRNISFGADSFDKTPLGRATREAIDAAVRFVVNASQGVAWSGRVVDASGDQLFINAGADAGLRPGDTFVVSAVVRELTDPASGALLGVIEDRVGEVEVLAVQPRYSIARMRTRFAAHRGDIVRPASH
jgi:curli biogenesis system outer membrane secretion channel CsgG